MSLPVAGLRQLPYPSVAHILNIVVVETCNHHVEDGYEAVVCRAVHSQSVISTRK
jgi:hypothetical protein